MIACVGIPYVSPGGTGKDCSRTGIDCSGLLVRAYKLQGASLYHGSNYIARHELFGKPERLTSEKQLQVGMAVFKWSKSGEPGKYRADGEGNFHHIGVVTGIGPLVITHASSVSGRVIQVNSIKGWTHFGRLAAVNYNGASSPSAEGKDMTQYKIVAASGDTVNLRRYTSTTSEVITKVPVGTLVNGTAVTTEGWTKVDYNGTTGYMMSKFLEPTGEKTLTLEERVEKLEARVAALEGGVG